MFICNTAPVSKPQFRIIEVEHTHQVVEVVLFCIDQLRCLQWLVAFRSLVEDTHTPEHSVKPLICVPVTTECYWQLKFPPKDKKSKKVLLCSWILSAEQFLPPKSSRCWNCPINDVCFIIGPITSHLVMMMSWHSVDDCESSIRVVLSLMMSRQFHTCNDVAHLDYVGPCRI